MAGCEKIERRVEEGTQKADSAVNNPPVTVPKPKPKGNEGVEVRRGDESVGRARVGEEPLPILHGQVEGLDVGETRRKATMKTGECQQEVGRAGGSGGRRAPPKPEKEVRGIGRRVSAA